MTNPYSLFLKDTGHRLLDESDSESSFKVNDGNPIQILVNNVTISSKKNIRNSIVYDNSYYYPEDRGISESLKLGRELAKRTVNDI